jgi:hypothetical protein
MGFVQKRSIFKDFRKILSKTEDFRKILGNKDFRKILSKIVRFNFHSCMFCLRFF